MSAVTTSPASAAPTSTSPLRWTFGRQLRSEWLKFWTVRSTIWTLSVMVVGMVGLVALISLAMRSAVGDFMTVDEALWTPFEFAVNMGSLAVAVLAVLTITGEYRTGMIHASVTAAPRRTPVLWSKLVILFAVVLVASAVAVLLAFVLQKPIMASLDGSIDLGDPESQRRLFGNVLYLATIGAFAFAVGALLRHSAAALATVLGLMLVVESLVRGIPWEPLEYVRPFMPSSSGYLLAQSQERIDTINAMAGHGIHLSAWGGYAVLVGWVVVLLGLAAVLLKRRDA